MRDPQNPPEHPFYVEEVQTGCDIRTHAPIFEYNVLDEDGEPAVGHEHYDYREDAARAAHLLTDGVWHPEADPHTVDPDHCTTTGEDF